MLHVGEFDVLESWVKSWLPADGVSPNHMDAMVTDAPADHQAPRAG